MTYYSFVCGAVAGVFLLSGAIKLLQPAPFRRFLDALVGLRLGRRLARAIPVCELVIGVALLTPLGRSAAIAAAVASVVFLATAIGALGRDDVGSCGCFGELDAATPHWFTLVRAVGVAAVTATTLILSFTERAAAPTDRWFVLMVGVLAGIGSAVAATLAGELLGLRRQFVALLTLERGRASLAGVH